MKGGHTSDIVQLLVEKRKKKICRFEYRKGVGEVMARHYLISVLIVVIVVGPWGFDCSN